MIKKINMIKGISSLQKKRINCSLVTDRQKEVFKFFTKRHPRYKIIRNKSLTVALVDINQYTDFEFFYKSINGKNSAAYEARKADRREYTFIEIDPKTYSKDIYKINTSSSLRQGQEMSEWYQSKNPDFITSDSIEYYGVLSPNNTLVAYCMIDSLGEVVNISKLLGHADHLKDGIMYLMLVEFMRLTFEEKKVKYIMYDTFFGASSGLKRFKTKLGFKPYNVKWVKK